MFELTNGEDEEGVELMDTETVEQQPKTLRAVYKRTPPHPEGYDLTDAKIWNATCARMLSELDQIFASDLELVHRYVCINRSLRRIDEDIAKIDAHNTMIDDPADTVAIAKAIGDLRRQDMAYLNLMRQAYRAIEGTVNERHRRLKERQKLQGGQVGVRHNPARAGVPSNQKSGGTVSWVNKARGGK